MSNPIRVATAALSGQIFAGRSTKNGLGFKEPRYDVTSDVLKAVVDKIGIGFQADVVSGDEIVCTIKIVGPDHPAAPSADKLRFNPTHRHLGRGTTYEVIGEARLQQAGQFGPVEGDSITVYRGEDGQLWCRAQSEFEDGRFVSLSTPDALKGDSK